MKGVIEETVKDLLKGMGILLINFFGIILLNYLGMLLD
ncbi:hypothetical protein C805_01729 [Eubacterium sp. 14-2]|nr:hypothetical protein C805_01729 [Eubacterium sp. 14-2]